LETKHKRDTLAAVILAAGLSRRMGQPKMLLPVGDGTLLQQIVRTYLQILPPEQIIVVTGFQASQIAQSVAAMKVAITFNPAFEEGMLSSVQAGISEANKFARDSFLALGDQPFIQQQTLGSLVDSHRLSDAMLSQPVHCGKSGHPLLISSRGFDEILSLSRTDTLKTFVNRHHVNAVETADGFVLNDVDTPSDYQRLLQLRSESCSLVEIS